MEEHDGNVAHRPVVGVFGYGSLANQSTLNKDSHTITASLDGFRRTWAHCVETDFGKLCALTIIEDPISNIFGRIIPVSNIQLRETDAREAGYFRQRVSPTCLGINACCFDVVYTYRSLPEHFRKGNAEYPIIMSYLLTVLSGHYMLFSHEGIVNFMQTTSGWDVPIVNDLAYPRYPRFRESVCLPIWKEIRETVLEFQQLNLWSK